MKKRFGIGDHIPEIRETDIPKLAHYADKEANPLYPVPVLMGAPELEQFYYMLMPESDEDAGNEGAKNEVSENESFENRNVTEMKIPGKGANEDDRTGN